MAQVHWKEARVWVVAWPGANDDIKAGRHKAARCLILPGVHHIDDEIWEQAKKVQDVKDRLESGQLVEIKTGAKKDGGKETTTEDGLPKTLAKLNVQDAVELIGGIMDADVLKAWSKTEKRNSVKDALKAQLKALEPDDEKDE